MWYGAHTDQSETAPLNRNVAGSSPDDKYSAGVVGDVWSDEEDTDDRESPAEWSPDSKI